MKIVIQEPAMQGTGRPTNSREEAVGPVETFRKLSGGFASILRPNGRM
jgi:hypothetical protein